ncbi:MAG TPA: cyclase [Chloroflexi bacterium]|nr:cyclase [Chloroflexota bacterium]HBY06354.1 cyclase [Chloroflexota bacterium]
MKTYDITVPIFPTMPVWPGDPAVQVERVAKIEEGANANVSRLAMSAHTGTHVDAPYHFLAEGHTLEKVPLNLMMGRAYVLHLPEADLITAEILENAEIPPRTRRILFKTRNSKIWARRETAFQTDFVALAADGAEYLVNRGVKLVGIDYLSVAPFKNSRPTHEILLKAGVLILEGVNLSEVSQGRYTLYCLPLNLQGVDGAPARAVLVGV